MDQALSAFRLPPRKYQLECFERFKEAPAFALFSEPGTGKTKTALDIVSWRWHMGMITGVLVFSSPKGVHAQWIEEQLPLHLWANVPVRPAFWNGRKAPDWFGCQDRSLQIFSANIDMINSDKGFKVLTEFCWIHRGRLLIIVDESDSIKTFSAKRSKRLRQLAAEMHCRQRMIMTGTPIAKDLTDEWAQFYFLDPNIIGHKYKTSFQAQYCIMGGFENRHVVGHRNEEQFARLTQPYIFRATKEQLDLPEKIYDTVQFDLTNEQQRLIKEIRDTAIAVLDEEMDMRVLASTAATAVLRMQQISCGHAVVDGEKIEHIVNPRMDALQSVLDQLQDRKVIVWGRFHLDILKIHKHLGDACQLYFGMQGDNERAAAKREFIENDDVRYLVATPDAAGRGLDGLQKVCSNAIYYSNSYNAIGRWQSEDRIHRIGQKRTATYIDLIARGSPDRTILRNLKAKKDLSTLVLDDLRKIIEGKDQWT